MQIHIVGGFLGSGKTTAIVAAARALMAEGKVVGIVTNDQGKYLVDSSFVSQAHLPGVEVTGGCFCCNYDDLDKRLDQLINEVKPEVVFAESVGSCADLVATVIKPMLRLRRVSQTPTSLSVFTDVRLLRLFLSGEGMPFSDEVSYIFGKQIEESHLVVLNKIDLLPPEEQAALLNSFKQAYPDKIAIPQCSLSGSGVRTWLDLIDSTTLPLPEDSLEIDYARYGSGEARLAWVDEEVLLQTPEGAGRQAALDIVAAILQRLRENGAPVGHVKFFFDDGAASCKVSLTTLDQPGWQDKIVDMKGSSIKLLINARVEMAAATLQNLLDDALRSSGWPVQLGAADAFHPKQPNPTHRIK